jgi:hypothetical protein
MSRTAFRESNSTLRTYDGKPVVVNNTIMPSRLKTAANPPNTAGGSIRAVMEP